MMMRSVRVLVVMVAFGAGSAIAAPCFVQATKGCHRGSLAIVDGIEQCKVGEDFELAFYRSRRDCVRGENGNVAAGENTGKIPSARAPQWPKKSARVDPPAQSDCFFIEPQSNGQDTCSKGQIVPVTSVYSDYQTDPNSSGGAPSVCSVAGWVVGRYHNDAGCKDAEPLPKVCWTQKSGSTDCDSMRPGFLVNTDNGIDLCKVGSSSGEMDFFFDNHCEHGNLAWNAKKSGKIPGAEKIDETSRMKPIVVEPICDAGLMSGACDDEQAKTEGQGPPPKRVVPTKPVRTKPSVKKAGSGG